MGKPSAVEFDSGETVANSVPGLRRPTSPARAGRKPDACPPILSTSQPKSWPGFGAGGPEEDRRERASATGNDQEPSEPREARALDALDEFSTSQLRQFFELLDRWDREA